MYSAVPVCERPVSVKNSVSEGHFIRFSKDLSEMECRLLGYEPTTKFQNLRCETIISLRLKSAKLKKKTYYHAFLRKILAFNLKIIIISEHVCEFRPVTICQRNVNRGKHRHYFNHICKYL